MKLILETTPGFNSDTPLSEAARALGWEVVTLQHVPFTDFRDSFAFVDSFEKMNPIPKAVLQDPKAWFHGSITAAKVAQKTTSWKVHAPWSRLRCAVYYAFLQERLFQQNWMLTTIEGVLADKEALFSSEMALEETLFFRPDSCDKIFTGMCISKSDFEAGYQRMIYSDPPPRTQVVVAVPQKILEEARFLIVDKKVVTGSVYRNGGKLEHVPASPEMLDMAQGHLDFCVEKGYNPALSWVLDLAFDGLEWRILEVGATSCCGFYACDARKFLSALEESLRK